MFTNIVARQISEWSEASGVDEATLKMAICLFGSFPLNVILKRLPDRNILLKNMFIIGVSSFYLFGVCEIYSGFRTLLISSSFTYLITKYLKSDLMPFINFIFVMGHLAFNHIHLQFFNDYDTSKIDISGAQMVLCMKLTGFAWNVYDGYRPQEELSSLQKAKAIREHPSLLNFVSYAFFYPSLLTGPSFEYRDYEQWLNNEMFNDLPESKKPGRTRKRNIPRSGRVSFYRVLQGIAWLMVWQKGSEFIVPDYVFTQEYTHSKSFIYKIGYLLALSFFYRLKYYAAWTISEASCILTGLGYNGYDKETQTIQWNRVQNIDIFGVETAQNIHHVLSSWNQNTNNWLKNYVYLRVTPKGQKPGFRATLATSLTSAFWHGTRPGYYLTFATGALVQTCGRLYRRNFRPIFLEADGKTGRPSKTIYDIVGFFVTQITLAYLVQPFYFLDWNKSLQVWGSVYYFVHIGIVITLVLFQSPLSKPVTTFLKSFYPKPTDTKMARANSSATISTDEPYNLAYPEAIDFAKTDLNDIADEMEKFKTSVQEWVIKHGATEEEANFKDAFKAFQNDIERLKKVTEELTHRRELPSPTVSNKDE